MNSPLTLRYKLSKKHVLSSLGLSSVVFLWPIQVGAIGAEIPLYLFISPFIILLTGFRNKDIFIFTSLLTIIAALTILQTIQGVSFTTPLRSFVAIPLFAFAFACVHRWLGIAKRSDLKTLFTIFRCFLFIQVFAQLTQLVLWYFNLYNTQYKYVFDIPRASGLFLEPSHIAFSLSPFIYLLFFHRRLFMDWLGWLGLSCLFLTFALSPSTTFVGIIAITLALLQLRACIGSFRSFFTSAILLLVIGWLVVWVILHVPFVSERIFSVLSLFFNPENISQNTNLSSLMFLKGWQMALASLQNYPLGAGFLNFQFLNEYSAVSLLNDFLYTSNMYSGTSLGFKIIGEYSYIGIFILVSMLYVFCSNLRKKNHSAILENFFLFSLIIASIRGTSYFDGAPLIALVIIYNHFIRRFSSLFVAKSARKYCLSLSSQE